MKNQIMIVDGYNVIGNWPELAKLKAEDHFDVARDRLLDVLAEYRSYEDRQIIVVFDAMYVPGMGKSFAKWDLDVIFTKEDQTADSYIEQLAQKLNTHLNQLTVVTSDQAEQWTIFSRGALRISSREFLQEVLRARAEFNQATPAFASQAERRNVPWDTSQLLMLEKMRRKLEKRPKYK
ncbi:YacP-like NYN domain-containing protein [Lacticaseibacillus saniviri]|uniref:PIN domain containing protein n=1 Tax=Lacticaseibacillus saniviri JCM 17471 = DSM 24301 TaxID=1293598 RepID=A0A0R2MWQ4_9LACO|nr:NYN domain-containing protein [Lacticaseibacillus saniviri]KRO18047.1 PIN domain containing protein [Lacticaseibacillus saniviri JCM 17471 = DSM 24301]